MVDRDIKTGPKPKMPVFMGTLAAWPPIQYYITFTCKQEKNEVLCTFSDNRVSPPSWAAFSFRFCSNRSFLPGRKENSLISNALCTTRLDLLSQRIFIARAGVEILQLSGLALSWPWWHWAWTCRRCSHCWSESITIFAHLDVLCDVESHFNQAHITSCYDIVLLNFWPHEISTKGWSSLGPWG